MFELSDIDYLKHIDDVVDRWSIIVVPFYSSSTKSNANADGFGSGFVVRYRNKLFLATASHVVDDAMKNEVNIIVINGHSILLENIIAMRDEQNDIAAFPLDNLLRKNGFRSVSGLDIDVAPKGEPLGLNLLLGYPGTKNRLNSKFKKTNRHLQSITAKKIDHEVSLKTEISNCIQFEYNTKKLIDSKLNKIPNSPYLHGMSGGPALEMRQELTSEHELKTHIRLVGVLVEWHQQQKVIVATEASSLIKLLDKFSVSLSLEQLDVVNI